MKEKPNLVRRVYRKLLFRDLDKIYEKNFSLPQKPRKNKKILDVGCGFGFELIRKFKEGYDCYGIDIDSKRIKKLNDMFKAHNVDAVFKVGSAEKLPFASNFFDEVTCRHVVEHIGNDNKVIQEMNRVLKKNGKLVLTVPNVHNLHTKFRSSLGLKNRYTDRTHLREYTTEQISSLVKENGFKIKKIEKRGFFPPVGLKVYFLLGHYIPVDKIAEKFGDAFPKNAAEIRILAVK